MIEMDWQIRTELLVGKENLERLEKSHVLVAGLGGVGAYVAELLARAGVGKLTIIDGDVVNISNKNRQLLALDTTVGKSKVQLMSERLLNINPKIELITIEEYIKDQAIIDLVEKPYDYIVDVIDTLAPKVYLLYYAKKYGQKIISSMGAGGKYFPEKIEIVDISETKNCRLAYYIRKRLHKLGVWDGIDVVYSPEIVEKSAVILDSGEFHKRSTVGTISYMPAVFGCFCASVVLTNIIGIEKPKS